MLTADFLAKLCPPPSSAAKRAVWNSYVEALTSAEGDSLLARFEITNHHRVAHALAQWAHESGGFTIVWESGDYSANRIMEIFGVGRHSAKVTQTEARRLAFNGPALFDRVYGLGNPKKAAELGNTKSGDGWLFRGCGIVQITGRAAHERYADKIGCSVADLSKPIYGLHAACLEWMEKRCNALADSEDGSDRALRAITKRVNGGYNGLPQRKGYYRKAARLLVEIKTPPVPVARSVTDRKPILEIGQDGQSVRKLQELLVRAGYIVPVDGVMGPKTESALAGFQVNYGLVATGRADDATWDMLEASGAEGVKTPKTRTVEEGALKKGSRLFRLLSRIHTWATRGYKFVFGAGALGASAEASGIDVVDNLSSGLDRIGAAWLKLNLPDAFTSPKGIAIVVAMLIGIILFGVSRFAKNGKDERWDDAELNGNLSV